MDIEKVKTEVSSCLSAYGNSEFSNEDVLKLSKAFVQRRLSQHKYTPKEALYAIDCITNFESLINYYKQLPETGSEILAQFNDEVFTIRADIETYLEKEKQHKHNVSLDQDEKQITEFLISIYNQNKSNKTQNFVDIVNQFLELPRNNLEIKSQETIKHYISRFLQYIKENNLEELSGKEILSKYGQDLFKDAEIQKNENESKSEKEPEI